MEAAVVPSPDEEPQPATAAASKTKIGNRTISRVNPPAVGSINRDQGESTCPTAGSDLPSSSSR